MTCDLIKMHFQKLGRFWVNQKHVAGAKATEKTESGQQKLTIYQEYSVPSGSLHCRTERDPLP